MWSQSGAGWWFPGNESFRSGFQARPNHCKLETDFNTFLGQRKPTSLLKHLSNASKETTCLDLGQEIKARFVCWTRPVKHFPEILNLSDVKCYTTHKSFWSLITVANNKISTVRLRPSCSTSTIGLARTGKPSSKADTVNFKEGSTTSFADKCEATNLGKSE